MSAPISGRVNIPMRKTGRRSLPAQKTRPVVSLSPVLFQCLLTKPYFNPRSAQLTPMGAPLLAGFARSEDFLNPRLRRALRWRGRSRISARFTQHLLNPREEIHRDREYHSRI